MIQPSVKHEQNDKILEKCEQLKKHDLVSIALSCVASATTPYVEEKVRIYELIKLP